MSKNFSNMGEGGYIRIQNKSKFHNVQIKVIKGRKVDNRGMNDIQGEIAPGQQLPQNGENKYGGVYEYIEGDVRFRVQKDGYFHLEAHVDGSSPSGLMIKVDHDNWWTEDKSPDTDSVVNMVADVDEIDGKSKIEIRVYDNFNAKTWMFNLQDNIQNTPLCQVAMPGTHDSGTYQFEKEMGASPDSDLTETIQEKLDHGRVLSKLTDFILKNVFDRLCKCQSKTLKEQLEHGIRYLDLRIAYHEETKTFWTCHGVYCVNMTDVLKQINEFLAENPKEIVLLDFNHFYAMDGHHKELADLITESLDSKAADYNVVKPNSPVNEFWDKGYQAVVLFHHAETVADSNGKLWPPRRCIASPWPNTGDAEELHDKLKDVIETKKEDSKFFVLQGILTPDGDSIKQDILESGGVSIESMSRECNCKITDWVETDFSSPNIVIIDFFNENCSLLPCVVNSNRSKS